MFCGKCGNKNEEGMKFCGSCGASVGQTETTSISMNSKEIVIGPVKFNAPDEDNATVTVANKAIQANLIFKIASVFLAVVFFFPMFSIQIRLFGISAGQSMNGWTTIFGLEGASGSGMAIFLLLIPIVIFVLFQFKKRLEEKVAFIKGKLFVLSTSGFGLGFLILLIVRSSVNSTWQGHIGNSAGFWLTLLFYLLAGVISVGFLLSTRGVNINFDFGGSKQSGNKTSNISNDNDPTVKTDTSTEQTKSTKSVAGIPNKQLSIINATAAAMCIITMIFLFVNIFADRGIYDSLYSIEREQGLREFSVFRAIGLEEAVDALNFPIFVGNTIINLSVILAFVVLLNICCFVLSLKGKAKLVMTLSGKIGAIAGVLLPLIIFIFVIIARNYSLDDVNALAIAARHIGYGRGYAYPWLHRPGVLPQMIIPLLITIGINAMSLLLLFRGFILPPKA